MKTFADTGYKMDPHGKFRVILKRELEEWALFKEWAHAMTWINLKLKEEPNLKWEIRFNP